MSDTQIKTLAKTLFDAHENASPFAGNEGDWAPESMADAYAVQDDLCALHEGAGRTRIGFKAGVTNVATLAKLGGERPLSGVLFDSFAAPESSTLDASRLIAPKVEAEIAFILRDELSGPGCHAGRVLMATEFIAPAIEIVDSRITSSAPNLAYIAADNVAASHFVLGGRAFSPTEFDLRTTGVVVDINGEPKSLGAGAAVWNHPAESVAELANLLAARGRSIPAGSVILSGSFTTPIAVDRNAAIHVRFQHFGTVSVKLATPNS